MNESKDNLELSPNPESPFVTKASQIGSQIVAGALDLAGKHSSILREMFGRKQPSVERREAFSQKNQTRRKLLIGLGAATAALYSGLGEQSDASAQESKPREPVKVLPEPPEIMAEIYNKDLPSDPGKPIAMESKKVEEKGVVDVKTFVDPIELKKSHEFQNIIAEFTGLLTFKTTIDGKDFSMPLPFAEVGEGYNFPKTPYPDGNIPSKMSPEMAQERFEKAISSGEFVSKYREKLVKYAQIDVDQLTPNEKLTYKNIKSRPGFTAAENYAYYTALQELGIYGDCNGTTYNALSYFYDKSKRRGTFDLLVKNTFPDLKNNTNPVINFNIRRFGDPRWAEIIDPPPVRAYRAGDIIALGDEQHSMLVIGWDPGKNALWIMQNTDESQNQGLDLFPIYIVNPDMQLQYQKWGNVKLAQDTTLKDHTSGESYQSRLQTPRSERAETQAQEQIGGTRKAYKIYRNSQIQKELESRVF